MLKLFIVQLLIRTQSHHAQISSLLSQVPIDGINFITVMGKVLQNHIPEGQMDTLFQPLCG